MQNKYLKFLLIVLIVAFIVPQITLAAWWNPFSWGIWNRIFHFQQQIQKQTQKQPKCTDSDGGINYNIKGNVSDIQNGKPVVEEDYCEKGKYLHEFYCHENDLAAANVESGGYLCPNGCENGACKQTKDQTAGWKTYTNTQYGFSFQYPKKYSLRMAEPSTNLFFIEENQKNIFQISISDLSKYASEDSYILGLCAADGPTASIACDKIITQENIGKASKFYLNNITTSFPNGKKVQKTVGPLYEIKIPNSTNTIFISEAGILFSTPNQQREDELNQILSTFKFTEKFPIIDSISPLSGAAGTKIEVFGKNFAGFEGDLNLWIENKNGIKGIIYGETGSTTNLIKFVLPSSVCQKDISYSGLPCPEKLVLTPGVYKIYAEPWGKKSNIVNFEITK